jgi:hypothetical protein
MARKRNRKPAKVVVGIEWSTLITVVLAGVGLILLGALVMGWYFYGRLRVNTQVPFGIVFILEEATEANALVVATMFPQAQRGVVTWLPADVLVPLYGGYGEYQARALHPLRELEDLPNQLVVESVAAMIQMPVNISVSVPSSVRLSTGGWPLPKSVLLRQLLWSSISLEERVHIAQLLLIFNQVQNYSWQQVNQDLARYIDPPELEGRRINPQLWGRFLDEKVTPALRFESEVEVAVVNTTGIPGLAETYGNIVRHSGWRVIGLYDAPLRTSELIVDEEYLGGRLNITAFLTENVLYTASMRAGEMNDYRAGVVIYLGEEIRDRYLNQDGYR